MYPIVLISSIFVGIGVLSFALLLSSALVLRRRQAIEAARAQGVVFVARKPSDVDLLGRVTAALPKGYIEWLDLKLVYAGRPDAWPLPRIISTKFTLVAFAFVLSLLWIIGDPSGIRILFGLLSIALGFFGPDLVLMSKASERQQVLTDELPDMLDQMTIAVEAGLGFDAAMAKVGNTGNGALADEFVRTLQDMSLGMTRRDAYEAMAERTSSDDVRRFTRSISQAESYGLAVANVLRVQAGEMRMKRRQRAEERAQKVPVKIVFPLTLCILPVLFIVILTPAILNLITALG